MMGRIRTIKPEFFADEDLYDAEEETGLPVRVAFAGLWTAADREGRFRWKVRELKRACLPYDDVDFSRVLDALATRGFIKKYTVGNDVFGWISSWKKHQVINNKERESELPSYNENNDLTREVRVDHATPTREVRVTQGKEGNNTTPHPPKGDDVFEEFWTAYPHRGKHPDPKKPAREKWDRKIKTSDPQEIISGARAYAEVVLSERIEDQHVAQAVTWLNQERWSDHGEVGLTPEEEAALSAARGLTDIPAFLDRRMVGAK